MEDSRPRRPMILLLAALASASDYATLAPGALDPAFPLEKEVTEALGLRHHRAAALALSAVDRSKLPGSTAEDFAFLHAWELIRAGNAAGAAALLDTFERAPTPPPEYVALVAGEALLGAGRPVEAISRLERVKDSASPIAVRARLALASAYLAAQRDADARGVYEALAARPDPATGSEMALGWLVARVGHASADAKPFAERLYRHYPGTSQDRAIADSFVPNSADKAWRADRLQERGDFSGAVALLKDGIDSYAANACVARLAYGRAQHKLNNVTIAAAILEPLGAACKDKDPDRGAKALYLAGKSYERKKLPADAARVYASIPVLYPTHSMADDGYALGGIARQDSGDLAGARVLWQKGMESYPDGDLAAENGWRLAWGAWLAGDTPAAIALADYAAARTPLESSPTDVLASMYWAGRWRAWPTDNALVADPKSRADAADRLEAVARRAPWHYYGGLAAAQLARLDAARAAALPRATMDRDDAPWQVPEPFIQSRAGQAMMALARVGLVREALAELATLPEEEFNGSLAAIRMELEMRAGDFLVGHDRLRTWLKTRPPETLGPNAYKILRIAYPQMYATEVKAATRSFPWDFELFHALVREESNFNKEIKSHAGACGLSQLMPATAKMVAKQMARPYSSSQIYDVDTNLAIGGYYLNSLLEDYGGSPMLALSSYNAGPGNTARWVAALPANAPVDTYTESITFRETRHYVKRVTSTWLMYRLLYGEGRSIPDWGALVVDASPG